MNELKVILIGVALGLIAFMLHFTFLSDFELDGGCKYVYRDIDNVTQCRWICEDEFGGYYAKIINRSLGDRSVCPESR